jgi:polysaccharide pyruvyl transferase WcaK-like protein
MFKILEEMGFNSTIIVPKGSPLNFNLSFVNRTIGSHLLFVKRDFSELKEEDFDYLMVSSDQTWNGLNLNVGFLKFAENWNVKKFIYAASTGNHLPFRENNKILIKSLLKNFTGISFREKGMVKLLEDSIGLKSEFVLDPTFLLSKNVYLNTIKNYQQYNFNKKDKFIFVYQLDRNYHIEKTIKKASELFNFKINKLQFNSNDYMESFLYGMNYCQAIITDSFHGTVFSIIFNKPFIAFSNHGRGKARFDSLKEFFSLDNRIIEPSSYSNININLLIEPLNIDQSKFNKMKKFSLNYLKRNLGMT